MPKIAEVKLSSCWFKVAGFRKNCDCGIAELRLRSNISLKSCGIAIAEALPSSCGIAIADSKKSCTCPPLHLCAMRHFMTTGILCWCLVSFASLKLSFCALIHSWRLQLYQSNIEALYFLYLHSHFALWHCVTALSQLPFRMASRIKLPLGQLETMASQLSVNQLWDSSYSSNCSLSLWRVVRGIKLTYLAFRIHGLFIT